MDGAFDALRVGQLGGNGTVTVDAGGTINTGTRNVYITSDSDDTGVVDVSGTMTIGSLYFGQSATSGVGRFTMNVGSSVSLSGNLAMANGGGAGNLFTYNGGSLSVGSNTSIDGATMVVKYDAAGSLAFGAFAIQNDGILEFNVDASGNVMSLGAIGGVLNLRSGSQIVVDMNHVAVAEGDYTLFSYTVASNKLAATSVTNVASGLNASIVDTGAEYQLQVVSAELYTTNGTPYSWLDQYGLTNYVADDVLDQDDDGHLTWQEYIAGTNPTNQASVLNVVQGPLDTVNWNPVAGRVYSVHWSSNLMMGFTNLADNIVYPQGSYTNTLPDAKVNHYQIKVRLP